MATRARKRGKGKVGDFFKKAVKGVVSGVKKVIAFA